MYLNCRFDPSPAGDSPDRRRLRNQRLVTVVPALRPVVIPTCLRRPTLQVTGTVSLGQAVTGDMSQGSTVIPLVQCIAWRGTRIPTRLGCNDPRLFHYLPHRL